MGLVVTSLLAPVASAGSALPLTLVKSGFARPLFVTNAGDSRLFVVEQGGTIRIVHDDGSVSTFLDITGIVSQDGGERGLLGLAFHPSYASNGLFYVTYVRASDNRDVLAEYRVTADPDVADPGSGRVLIELKDPYSNHNGGWIAFHDGYLYMGMGDGGGAGDAGNRAQSKRTLFGKILRISPEDPDGAGGPLRYTIPPTNPYVGVAGKDEIFAKGLRNPWRCSFDDLSGDLWCADVGQEKYEEIDHVASAPGLNFGWRKLEGRHYYRWSGHKSGTPCSGQCFTLPIAEYAHSAFGGGNCSVTGGYVSRRSGAALYGNYVFGDFCSGKVWIIPAGFGAGAALPDPIADTDYRISSFGEDAAGRIYLVDLNGAVYLLDQS
jgi:glucose/arabinose dehydrogenase